MAANRYFTDWVAGDLITATKLNKMKNNMSTGSAGPYSTGIAAGTTFAISITVSGATVGDGAVLLLDPSNVFTPDTIVGSVWVVAANTVYLILRNYGAASASCTNVTWSVMVIHNT